MKGCLVNKHRSQTGSVHLVIIVILVAALFGALGFVFWQNFMQSKSSSTQDNTAIKATSNTDSNSSNNVTASTVVGNFYSEYMSVVNDSSITDGKVAITKELAIVTKYGTSNFVTQYNTVTGMDNAICLQQYNGKQIITGQKENGSTTAVSVQEDMSLYNGDGSVKAQRDPLNISVNVVNQSGFKIDSITCPTL